MKFSNKRQISLMRKGGMMTKTYSVQLDSTVSTNSDSVQVTGSGNAINPRAHLIAVVPEVVEVDYSAGAEILDRAARRKLGISGEEFIARWDAGEYGGPEEHVKAEEVSMLLPFARPNEGNAR
ncbi:hypothetical protein [Streptomyces sp. NBC_00564]|uniref:hypothetical protein n=1 Tax=Streptomyces sp. NBC_00564 TaxID=2903663 RepID=UPI00352C63D0|nr:hypothetical protein OG256_24890 [Streptomyces sp. NBC_00564]